MNYNFFLIDDDVSVTSILSRIIVNENLGDVVGVNQTGDAVISDVKITKPDIVIVDLLLPSIDGVTLSRQLKNAFPNLPLIMISEVQSKDMVSQAYDSGIEFYINKPINVKEVSNVIKRVDEKIQMKKIINSFKSTFENIKALDDKATGSDQHLSVSKARTILSELGILSEGGARDILYIVEFICGVHDNVNKRIIDYRMTDLYSQVADIYAAQGEQVLERTIEQRVRRAVAQAMQNIAKIGLEDFNHEYFYHYSHALFDYSDLRSEMNYLSKRDRARGKTNIKRFITGLIQEIRA